MGYLIHFRDVASLSDEQPRLLRVAVDPESGRRELQLGVGEIGEYLMPPTSPRR